MAGEAMDPVITVPALGDNFIYLYRYDQRNAFAVDPGESSAVLGVLRRYGLNLTMILVTHHHWDHVAGVDELKKISGCEVIGGDRRIRSIDHVVGDGQILEAGDVRIQVIATPGHTQAAVCYHLQPSKAGKNGILWTGDTLFIGGCGRLFECDARTMWDSLVKLTSLPDETVVYCGHDYTVENYEFPMLWMYLLNCADAKTSFSSGTRSHMFWGCGPALASGSLAVLANNKAANHLRPTFQKYRPTRFLSFEMRIPALLDNHRMPSSNGNRGLP